MICSTRSKILFLVAAAVLAGGGCSAKDETAREDTADESAAKEASKDSMGVEGSLVKPDSQPSTGTSGESATGPKSVFVEVVFELAQTPFADDPLPEAEADRLYEGYHLKRIGPDVLGLYTAVGKSPDEKAFLWVGSRSHNHIADGGRRQRSLEAAAGKEYILKATRGEGWSDPLAGLYVDKIELSIGEDQVLTIEVADGEPLTLQRGQSRSIALKQLRLDRGEWVGAVIAAFEGARGEAPDREEVTAQLDEAFSGSGPISLFSRTSVIYHGGVDVSGFDALEQWRLAHRSAAEGLYEDAEEALELVLEAVPRFREGAELLVRITELLEAGAEPARITGKLKFPDGMPTEEHKAMWKDFGAGSAVLAMPEAHTGSGFASAAIEDGGFAITVPTGTYRLTVVISGFKPVDKTIELSGDEVVVIEVQP